MGVSRSRDRETAFLTLHGDGVNVHVGVDHWVRAVWGASGRVRLCEHRQFNVELAISTAFAFERSVLHLRVDSETTSARLGEDYVLTHQITGSHL